MTTTLAPRGRLAALLLSIGLLLSGAAGAASEREETLINRNTTLNLIEMLVKRGVIGRADADAMIAEATARAVADAKAEIAREAPSAPSAVASTIAAAPTTVKAKGAGDSVHVYYIPQAVKDQLGREVGDRVRREVVAEVKSDAKKEAWGVPAALPEWVNRFTLSGDLRMRGEANLFGSENQRFSYFDWPRINAAGLGVLALGPDAFRNTTVDRLRLRNRLRLNVQAVVTDGLVAGARLATSNDRSPIALDQNLGQDGRLYDVALDRAFIRYDLRGARKYDWLTVWAGRHENPWFASDAIFDRDLSFEGIATTLRMPLTGGPARGGKLDAGSFWTNWGVSEPSSLFLTLGASPLQEVGFSPRDKWLVAAQAGLDWGFGDDSRFKFGLAYYDYQNVAGRQNALNSRTRDFTAPRFFTQGNSLMRISNDIGETAGNPRLVGLASDFNVVDATMVYDYARFAPLHLIGSATYVRNIGFDRATIRERTGQDIEARTAGWQTRVELGYPRILHRHEWNVELAYRRMARDAVLDAYSDSMFHLGGTDAKGWILGASYGLAERTFATMRWLSADAIDGPPFGVDVVHFDVSTGF